MVDERRLTTRVLEKWKTLAQDGRLPRRAEVVPETFGKDYPNCLLIELAPDLTSSHVLYVGDVLLPDGPPEARPLLSDHPENSLLRLATAKISAVVAKRAPVTFGGTGVRNVTAILYRAILLPLSDDGETIDHVIGAINFKEISAVEEYSDQPRLPPSPVSAADAVTSYLAFSSRRVAFAPSAARRPMPVTIK
jgi:hypothetical protein